jgi:hypothetical protein
MFAFSPHFIKKLTTEYTPPPHVPKGVRTIWISHTTTTPFKKYTTIAFHAKAIAEIFKSLNAKAATVLIATSALVIPPFYETT